MTEFIARVKVVLSAAVTWLVVASSVVTVFADEIAPIIPAPWSERASAIAVTVLGVLAAAIAIIRRVSPVLPDERGILPQ
jgi:hypothetical protein